jgi:hypothetical protein
MYYGGVSDLSGLIGLQPSGDGYSQVSLQHNQITDISPLDGHINGGWQLDGQYVPLAVAAVGVAYILPAVRDINGNPVPIQGVSGSSATIVQATATDPSSVTGSIPFFAPDLEA